MQKHTITPPSFVIFAMAGGMLFILGGIITAMSPNARAILIASAIAFLLLGVYAVAIAIRHNRLVVEIDGLTTELHTARSADAGLRARLGVTLREPLTTVVGITDRMLSEPEMAIRERQSLLTEVRNNAREVEHLLADLAAEERFTQHHLHADGVVLLDEEVRSIASTIATTSTLTVDLHPARAWGDSAVVRQILRTVIGSAASSGSDAITLTTEETSMRATVTLSGRGEMLPMQAVAALTGNTESADAGDETYVALREVRDMTTAMGGIIGYAEALGRSHIVVEFEAAGRDSAPRPPEPLAVTRPAPGPDERRGTANLSFAATMDLRPERPSASIRFS